MAVPVQVKSVRRFADSRHSTGAPGGPTASRARGLGEAMVSAGGTGYETSAESSLPRTAQRSAGRNFWGWGPEGDGLA